MRVSMRLWPVIAALCLAILGLPTNRVSAQGTGSSAPRRMQH